ncbi:MAG: hypothetical protein NT167_27275 [Verrucomicrobia bacterium]|nr:hypothetical protein [Verrucomicrobiota bacterium]
MNSKTERKPPSPKPAAQQEDTACLVREANRAQDLSVIFALPKPDAKRVSLCGDFNDWSPGATPMARHNDIVDGDWIADPTAQNNVPNEHGSLNLVVEV